MRSILMLSIVLLAACSSPAPRTSAHSYRNATPSDLVNYAQSLLGVRYRYGGNNPASGFDCSGFVTHVYHHTLGINLPRSTTDMSRRGKAVARDELRAGDLVFFNTLHRKFSHVGIYLGANNFIHSPSSGGNVRIDDMTGSYWRDNYNGARRISD